MKTACVDISEVDPEYPNELHGLHNGYPVVPEKVAIMVDILSRYCSGNTY